MKGKQLIYLLIAVVVLGGLYWLAQRSSVPTMEEEFLVEVDTSLVQSISVYHDGQTVTLERNGEVGWQLTNPLIYPANTRFVDQLLEKLTDMRIESVISKSRDKWAEFEVDTTGYQLTVVSEDGDEVRLVLGKAAELYRQTYARLADSEETLLIKGTYGVTLNRTIDNWRDKRIYRGPQHEIVGVQSDSLHITREGEAWTIHLEGGETKPADTAAATRVQSTISRLRTSTFPEASEYEGMDWSSPDKVLTVELANAEPMVLRFYEDPENERRYYVRQEGVETVYTVFEGIYKQLFKTNEELIADEDVAQQPGDPAAATPSRPQGQPMP